MDENSADQSTGDYEGEEESEILPDDIDQFFYDSTADDREVVNDKDLVEITPRSIQSKPNQPELLLSELISTLTDCRLLVLAGDVSEKRIVARKLAWEFAENQHDLEGVDVKAYEYKHTANSNGLLQLMDATDKPSVFVLTDIEPHQFGGSLQRLHSAAQSTHWLVLTTERPEDSWNLLGDSRKSWLEPSRGSLYSPGSLHRYLDHRIIEESSGYDTDQAATLSVSHDARDLALRLASPDSIDYYVAEYFKLLNDDAVDEPDVEAILAAAINPPDVIKNWFVNKLTQREQSIAIALTLVAEMDEVSAFEIIETLMDGVWRRRDAAFQFIDYGDLSNLREHFLFEQDHNDIARIVCRGSDSRFHMLKAAWPTHRRQVLSALQALTELARQSINGSKHSLNAFRLRNVRKQFRKTVSMSIGDCTRLSLDAVEPILFTLLADGRVSAHVMLAEALGQLRSANSGNDIFELLRRWRGHSELHRILSLYRNRPESDYVETTVGSALAITIGRLASFDKSNEIHQELVDLMKAYCASEQLPIIEVLSLYTLPYVIPLHPVQMQELLPELFERVGDSALLARKITYSSGVGLGNAMLAGSDDARKMVENWIESGIEKQPIRIDDSKVGIREKQMAAGIVSLSLLGAESINDLEFSGNIIGDSASSSSFNEIPLNAESAGYVLGKVLESEKHPFVREAALIAVNKLLAREFDAVVVTFEALLGTLSPAERQTVIASVVDFHRKQRRSQKGGDAIIRINNRNYPIWYDKETPDTTIQKKVFDWAANANEERLSAFAADAVMAIRREHERTEESEREQLKHRREAELEEAKAREIDSTDRPIGHAIILGFLQRRIIVPLSTRGHTAMAGALAGQLAVALHLPDHEQEELINRYRTAGQDQLADALKSALWYDKHKNSFLLLSLALAVTALLVVLGG